MAHDFSGDILQEVCLSSKRIWHFSLESSDTRHACDTQALKAKHPPHKTCVCVSSIHAQKMCVCLVCVSLWGGDMCVCVCLCLCYVCVIYIQVTIGAKKSIRSIEAVGKDICEAPGVNANDGPRSSAKAAVTVNCWAFSSLRNELLKAAHKLTRMSLWIFLNKALSKLFYF